MDPSLGSLLVGLVVLGLVFLVIESISPAVRGQPRWRRDSRTDLAYWFFTPLVTKAISRIALIVAVVAIAALARVPLEREHIEAFVHRPTWLSQQPAAFQIVAALFVGDLLAYWVHRLFHRGRLWRFHAVHHSPRQLDWLASVRVHPVNEILGRLMQVIPLFLMGFKPGVVAAYVPLLTLYALLLHANVSWTFGPLRYVFASPAFHRWHHTSQAEGQDKNFAGLFPIIDVMFGTFYMPPGRLPERFGVEGDVVPDGFLAQLVLPFRRSRIR